VSEPAFAFSSSCPNHPEETSGLAPCARCGREFCPSCLISLQGRLSCAGCKDEVLRDVISGTASAVDLAGPGKRFAGAFIDGVIVAIPVAAVTFTSILSSRGETGLFAAVASGLLGGVILFVYDGLMTASSGQTVGKKLVGTKVVSPNGRDIEAGQAWIRSGSRAVMGLTRILGLIDALFVYSDKRRTLHDRIARTVVVNWRA